jgi:hypothetical protein
MVSRRLDDRIRELCATVVSAQEEEVEPTIHELKQALREHTARLRRLAASKIVEAKEGLSDRRSHGERRPSLRLDRENEPG